jgi:hypothetical protein
MRTVLTILLVLPTTWVAPLQSQVDYNARLGLTYSTKLVRDLLIQEVEVRQSLAPTLALGASLPIAPLYRAGLEATLTTSGYHSTEGNTETDLGTLRTGSITLGLDGPVWRTVRWRAGVGLIRYWPTEDSGIFLRGGSTRFLAGAGVDYRPPVSTRWDLILSLRYDWHRFNTEELNARGFTGGQGVHRIAASIGLARGRR